MGQSGLQNLARLGISELRNQAKACGCTNEYAYQQFLAVFKLEKSGSMDRNSSHILV
jgi:hypothetical protein